jgi:hypothetical protein
MQVASLVSQQLGPWASPTRKLRSITTLARVKEAEVRAA